MVSDQLALTSCLFFHINMLSQHHRHVYRLPHKTWPLSIIPIDRWQRKNDCQSNIRSGRTKVYASSFHYLCTPNRSAKLCPHLMVQPVHVFPPSFRTCVRACMRVMFSISLSFAVKVGLCLSDADRRAEALNLEHDRPVVRAIGTNNRAIKSFSLSGAS